jgi:hypothetical protein
MKSASLSFAKDALAIMEARLAERQAQVYVERMKNALQHQHLSAPPLLELKMNTLKLHMTPIEPSEWGKPKHSNVSIKNAMNVVVCGENLSIKIRRLQVAVVALDVFMAQVSTRFMIVT